MSDIIKLSEAIAHMEQGGVCVSEEAFGDLFKQRLVDGKFEFRPVDESEPWLKDETPFCELAAYIWRKSTKMVQAPAVVVEDGQKFITWRESEVEE